MSDGLGFGRQRLVETIIKENWDVDNPRLKNFSFNELLFILQETLSGEGKPYFDARAIHRGHAIFRSFVQHLLYRNIANYDSMVLITADKGVGKSSAGIMLARYWCSMLGIKFNPARHIAYNNADVMNKIDALKKFEPIVCVTGDSKINVKINGIEQTKYIRDLIKLDEYEVLSYNIKKDMFEYQKPKTGVVFTKKDKVFEVELENGIKICATKDHKFLTKNRGYVKLKDLTEDDEIILNSKKCLVCGNEFVPKSFRFETCSKKCSKKYVRRKYKPTEEKEWYKKYYQKKFKTDILYRIRHNLLTRLNGLKKGLYTKSQKVSRFEYLMGCNEKQLKKHLEKQFVIGMSWKNYGIDWSIDHIKPLVTFNLKTEWKTAFHYTNLQPLWMKMNSSKGRWMK